MDGYEKKESNSSSKPMGAWALISLWTVSFILMCTLVGIDGSFVHDRIIIVSQQTGGSGVGSWSTAALVLAIFGALWVLFGISMVFTGAMESPVWQTRLAFSTILGDAIAAGLLLYVTVIYGRYFKSINCNQLDEITFGTNFWQQGEDHSFACWGTSNPSRCGRAKAVPGLSGTVAVLLIFGCFYLWYGLFRRRFS